MLQTCYVQLLHIIFLLKHEDSTFNFTEFHLKVTDEIAGSDAEDVSDDDDKEDEVSTEPETDEELVNLTQFTEEFHPFTEFPEPKLLKMANDVFTGYNKPVPHNGDGKVCPYPCPSWKQDVFSLKDFTELDAYAVEVRTRNNYLTILFKIIKFQPSCTELQYRQCIISNKLAWSLCFCCQTYNTYVVFAIQNKAKSCIDNVDQNDEVTNYAKYTLQTFYKNYNDK